MIAVYSPDAQVSRQTLGVGEVNGTQPYHAALEAGRGRGQPGAGLQRPSLQMGVDEPGGE